MMNLCDVKLKRAQKSDTERSGDGLVGWGRERERLPSVGIRIHDACLLGLNVERDNIRSIRDEADGGGRGGVPMNTTSQVLRPARTEETVSQHHYMLKWWGPRQCEETCILRKFLFQQKSETRMTAGVLKQDANK